MSRIHDCDKFSFLNISRLNKRHYKEEKTRQRHWVPEETYGEIQDIILDPHLQRSTTPKKCPICKVLYERDPNISVDHERRKNLEKEQGKLMGAGASSTSYVIPLEAEADSEPTIEEIE